MKLVKKYLTQIRYALFGIITTVVSIYSFFLFTDVLNWNYMLANILAWVLATGCSFLGNKFYVFRSEQTDIVKEVLQFFSLRVFSLILELFCLLLFIDLMHIDILVAKLITHCIVVSVNYIASHFYIFNNR